MNESLQETEIGLYPYVVLGCIAHALSYPITVYYIIRYGWPPGLPLHPNFVVIAIPVTWLLWVFPLWLCRDGSKSRVIVPLILGAVALCPGFLFLVAMAAYHSSH